MSAETELKNAMNRNVDELMKLHKSTAELTVMVNDTIIKCFEQMKTISTILENPAIPEDQRLVLQKTLASMEHDINKYLARIQERVETAKFDIDFDIYEIHFMFEGRNVSKEEIIEKSSVPIPTIPFTKSDIRFLAGA